MRWGVYFLVLGAQLASSAPRFLQTCDDMSIPLYLIHHALDVFLFWSVLFVTTRTEVLLHLLYAVVTFLHWISYNNRCILTVWMNRRCGYPEDVWLDSIVNRLGLRAWSEWYQIIWVSISIAINLYRFW